jgi:integrase
MTAVHVKGLNRYKSKGTTYCYHRKTGKRLNATFGTAEFLNELEALERSLKIVKAVPGSLGMVVAEYRQSPDWASLRPKTRLSYERALAVLKALDEMPVIKMDRQFVFALRDRKIFPKHGAWLANYTITVLNILFRFAEDRGWLKANPLSERVKKIKIKRDDQGANRIWSEQECNIVIDRAPAHIRLPLALAMFAGFRKTDFLSVPMTAVNNGTIAVKTSKRGVQVSIPVHPILAAAISARPNSDATQIAVNSYGEPWTETGFNASWNKFKKKLEAEGVIEPGLTPHGLRHSLGTRLREAGADDRTISDILGQRSSSMARHYSENATLPENAKNLLAGLNLTGINPKQAA